MTAAVLGLMVILSIVGSALIGPVHASLRTALAPGGEHTSDFAILFRARLPRVLLGGIVGGALACAGAALQALLGNPLADPTIERMTIRPSTAAVTARRRRVR